MSKESEPTKNPFDALLDRFREIVREEIRAELAKARPNGAMGADELLDVEQAAAILKVSTDWLYHNAKELPFTRKLGPKKSLLRFSLPGIQRWIESKKFSQPY